MTMDVIQRKEVTLLTVATLTSLLFFWSISAVYQGQTDLTTLPLLLSLVGLLWVAFMALCLAFVTNSQSLQWSLLILPPIMALLSTGFEAVAFLGSLLLFLALLSAERNIRQEINNRITYTTITTFRPGVRLLLFGVAAFALALALPLIRDQVQSGEITLPVKTTRTVVQSLTPIISGTIPNYQPDMTIDQIIQNQIIRQEVPDGFVLPPTQLQQSRQEIGRRLGLNLNGSETIPDILSQVTNRSIQNIAQGDGLIVTLILVLLALLAIRALIPLLVWPILLGIMGLVYLAHRTHLIRKLPTQVTVERFQL